MKEYSNIISLVRNGRGVYCLDPSMGCSSGMTQQHGGCYGDCYAAKAAKRYGHDFSKTVLRYFESERHKRQISLAISRIKLPFVRMGCSGDPSENWEHTLSVCKALSGCNKEIVIITRHWTVLTDDQLNMLSKYNVCINTSVSALDNPDLMNRCLEQYHRIKPYCKSILRIVSCDFNLENETGKRLAEIQDTLFINQSTLDTVFRPSKNNRFITEGIINVGQSAFLGKMCLMSKSNRKTFVGKCGSCMEMCGVNIDGSKKYKSTIVKQLSLV